MSTKYLRCECGEPHSISIGEHEGNIMVDIITTPPAKFSERFKVAMNMLVNKPHTINSILVSPAEFQGFVKYVDELSQEVR